MLINKKLKFSLGQKVKHKRYGFGIIKRFSYKIEQGGKERNNQNVEEENYIVDFEAGTWRKVNVNEISIA